MCQRPDQSAYSLRLCCAQQGDPCWQNMRNKSLSMKTLFVVRPTTKAAGRCDVGGGAASVKQERVLRISSPSRAAARRPGFAG